MASKNLTRLNVSLTASTGPFGKALNGAGSMLSKFGNSVTSTFKSVLSPLNLLAGGLSSAAIVAGIKKASSAIDVLAKSADSLGMTTQGLAGLQHAAGLAGVQSEKMTAALARSNRMLGEAAMGSASAARWFDRLGLSVEELQKMSPEQRFSAYAEAMKNVGTNSERAAISAALFEDAQGRMLPLLMGGAAGLAAAAKEADQFGLAVSRVDAAKVEAANDAFSKTGAVVKGVFNQLAIAVAPFVDAFSNAMIDSAKSVDGLGTVADRFVSWMIRAGGQVANSWQGIGLLWDWIKVKVYNAAEFWARVVDAIIAGGQWVSEKLSAAWDRIGLGFQYMGNVVQAGWQVIRLGIAHVLQWMGGQLSSFLDTTSRALQRVKGMAEVAESLAMAAGSVRAGTGDAIARVQTDMRATAAEGTRLATALAAANERLVGSVATTGSEFARSLSAAFGEMKAEAQVALDAGLSEAPAHEAFEASARLIQQQAQLRAEARAAEVEAQQAHNQVLMEVEEEALEQREEQQREWWARMIDSAAYQNTQKTLSGFSAFFGNLEKLQSSHSKRARKIGDVAAKAKIVSDTAAAAMASYQALAGIPIVGPALGAAAAAAAVAAGGVQLQQVGKSTIGGAPSGPADTSTGNLGGIATPNVGAGGPMRASGGTDGKGRLVLPGSVALDPTRLAELVNEAGRSGFVFDGIDLQ